MTDEEIEELCREIDRMAQRVGCRFVPDPEKLLAFKCAQHEEREMRKEYQRLKSLK